MESVENVFMSDVLTCFSGATAGGDRGFPASHASAAPKRVFAVSNLKCGERRKQGDFRAAEKTLKKVQKIACIDKRVLISYSPVAPLKATPRADAAS